MQLVPRASSTIATTANTCVDIQTQLEAGDLEGPEPTSPPSQDTPFFRASLPRPSININNSNNSYNIISNNITSYNNNSMRPHHHTLSIKRSHSSPSTVRLAASHEAIIWQCPDGAVSKYSLSQQRQEYDDY